MEPWQIILTVAGPFILGGAAYGGVKAALNGTVSRTVRIEDKVDRVHEKVDNLHGRVATIEGKLSQ